MKLIQVSNSFKFIRVSHVNTQEEIRRDFAEKLESLNIDTWSDIFDIGTTGMPDYDDILERIKDGAGEAELRMMRPSEYKSLVAQGFWTYKSNKERHKTFENFEDEISKRDPIKIDNVLKGLLRGSKFPIPVIHYQDGGKSFWQEGNHRSEVAELLGVSEIPVLIVNPIASDDLDLSGYDSINEIRDYVVNELSNGDPWEPGDHMFYHGTKKKISDHFYVTLLEIFEHFDSNKVNFSLAKSEKAYFEAQENPEAYFANWINGDKTDSETYRREFYEGFDSESFYSQLVSQLSQVELFEVYDAMLEHDKYWERRYQQAY
jgi:hypothetical protein